MRGVHVAEQLRVARLSADALRSGTVFRKSQGTYWVHADGRSIPCAISSRLRKVLIYPIADSSSLHARVQHVEDIRMVDPVAIGDIVRFSDAGDGTGMILEVVDRSNALVRRAAGPKPIEQVIVANVDQALCVMAAAQPKPSWELMDRYLAAAEASGIPAVVCVTKIDLVDRGAIEDELETYRRIGYGTLVTSAATGEGIDELRDLLRDRVSVLAGKSGVGKTSLLNAVQPELGLRVNAVSGATGKGKHTTTHLEMFALDIGGSVVDTPGMREFALWNVHERELADLFPDLRPYVGACRFGLDCSHSHEPGCAIKQAVAAGDVSERRHQSYLRLLRG